VSTIVEVGSDLAERQRVAAHKIANMVHRNHGQEELQELNGGLVDQQGRFYGPEAIALMQQAYGGAASTGAEEAQYWGNYTANGAGGDNGVAGYQAGGGQEESGVASGVFLVCTLSRIRIWGSSGDAKR
jgi:hypothetical protein